MVRVAHRCRKPQLGDQHLWPSRTYSLTCSYTQNRKTVKSDTHTHTPNLWKALANKHEPEWATKQPSSLWLWLPSMMGRDLYTYRWKQTQASPSELWVGVLSHSGMESEQKQFLDLTQTPHSPSISRSCFSLLSACLLWPLQFIKLYRGSCSPG